MSALAGIRGSVAHAMRDLLYGGRNEYLDVVRVLAFLGGLSFLGMEWLKSVHLVHFEEVPFATGWAAVLGATVAAIWGRGRADREGKAVAPADRGEA